MSNNALSAAMERASKIKLMIFDVDGVLTDGGLRYGAEGELIKTFNVLDGHGIKLLQEYGVQVGIITARNSAIVARRSADLGIQHLKQGVHDKRLAFEQKLYLIIASSDYIYGTNYQFCHCFIGKDLTNMTQQKIIQAMGRVGRSNIQQEYTIRFRDDQFANKLFLPVETNMEAINMCKLFVSDDE